MTSSRKGGGLVQELQVFEWGEVPPGAGAAAHVHTRTEELFIVLEGLAEMGLGDERREVGPGDAILTGCGGSHWITAIGDEPLRLLIFEAMPPDVAARLPSLSPVATDE